MKKTNKKQEEVVEETKQEEFDSARPLDSLYTKVEEPEEIEEVEPSENDNEEAQAAPEEAEGESPKQSWKELRAKADEADKLKKERDEYYGILKQIEEEAKTYQSKMQVKKSEPEEDDFDYNAIDDDEILTGKELKRAWSKDQKRIAKLEENIKRQQRYSKEAQIEAELKGKFSDFDEVLNASNISKLREMRPGLAKSLSLNPDLKEQAVETYQSIKDLGIYQQEEYNPEKVMAQRNASKPKTINSVGPQSGNSPLSKANAFANGLTEDLKKQLYKEMLEKSRG